MALNLRDFLAALGDDLIRVDDEIDPITQAGALCSASPTACSRACPAARRSSPTARARK